MTQVPWLNRATGFALGAHALQWAGLTLALAWLEWEGPTSGNSKIFQKAFWLAEARSYGLQLMEEAGINIPTWL